MSTIDWVLSTLSILVIIGMTAAMIVVTIVFRPKKTVDTYVSETETYVEYGPTSNPPPMLDAPKPRQEHVSYVLKTQKRPRQRVRSTLANMDVQLSERQRRDRERRAAYPRQT